MPRIRKKKTSKYEEDAMIITSKVVGIEQQNCEIRGKVKNVFFLESKVYPETGRMCIMWGYTSFNVGDLLQCKGRITPDGTFLVWSLMILKREEKYE